MSRFVTLAIVCFIGAAVHAADTDGIKIDKEKNSVIIDCKIAPRKLEYLKGEIYAIEVIGCWPHPKGKKAHETVVTFDVKPSDVHKAIESLGLKAGKPVMGQTKEQSEGPEVSIFLEIPGADGQPKRVPIEKTLIDPKSNKPMPKVKWRFTGSVMSKPNADKDETVYGADITGTLITIFPVTNETVIQTNLAFKDQEYMRLETDKTLLPKEGTPVKLILEVKK
jgi:hypothetical protein